MGSETRKFLPPAFVPLFAAYPVLFIASANPGQVQLADLAGVAGVVVLVTIAAWALLRALAKAR